VYSIPGNDDSASINDDVNHSDANTKETEQVALQAATSLDSGRKISSEAEQTTVATTSTEPYVGMFKLECILTLDS
jgi:hypothetical protein